MLIESTPRHCMTCNKSIRGRTDKKFCDDYCRNSYNNQLKAPGNNTMRNINNTLRKNRRILEGILSPNEKMQKISREKLLEQGFQFKYCTHTYCNPKGNLYHFCYDYGYLALENNWFLVVKRSET
jgi:predicted nucleic acid-binding Zn ribbon protein